MNDIINYYNKHGKGTELKNLLNDENLKDKYPKEMDFFRKIKFTTDNQNSEFAGNLLMFTKNNEFKKYVSNIILPLKINFPADNNINDIDGRIKYTEELFLTLKSKISKTDYKNENRFQLLMMYIAKVHKINIEMREEISNTVKSQRMAGDTLEELHKNFKIVEPLIRSDFEKIFKSNIDKTGYPFSIKSTDSIASKIHMAQEKFFIRKRLYRPASM